MNESLIFPVWFELICDVISEVLPKINLLEEKNRYIGSHLDYPILSAPTKSGFPSIYKSSFGGSAKDYSEPIKWGKNNGKQTDSIYLTDLPSYTRLLEYSKSEHAISKYFENDGENARQGLLEYGLLKTVSDLVDHYKHRNHSKVFEPEVLEPSYRMLETGYFSKKLPIDIVVPLVLTKFEPDNFLIKEHIELVRMSNHFQQSRGQDSDASVNPSIVHAATHALILRNFEVPNTTKFSEDMGGVRWNYHFKEIDDFLAALRITTGTDTGYAQTIFRPIGWSKGFTADLDYLAFGPMLRKFPSIFENNFWNLEVSPLSQENLHEASELYNKLCQNSDTRINIAIKRLNSCYLRDEEEDSILDSIIALETLLLQDDKEGITYKLAMRLTALLIITEQLESQPAETFISVKRLYAYRSAIVHGNQKAARKAREVRFENGVVVATHSLALQYLRLTLKAMILQPQYLNSEQIDKTFLSRQLPS